MPKLTAFCAAALFALCSTHVVRADSDQIVLTPVKTAKAAGKLKMGSWVAVDCDKCNGISVFKVDASRSHLHSFKCASCKTVFKTISTGRGDAANDVAIFTYSDAAGHTAHLHAQ